LPPLLSIIIPAHNEESRLPASLEKVLAFLRTQEYDAEVMGSGDTRWKRSGRP
jgi:glycosyltransferase involved in cell wall biosynthesis